MCLIFEFENIYSIFSSEEWGGAKMQVQACLVVNVPVWKIECPSIHLEVYVSQMANEP